MAARIGPPSKQDAGATRKAAARRRGAAGRWAVTWRQGRRLQVIGRFLLGSGLGALVGTGLLALASVVASAPGRSRLADPAPTAAAEMPEIAAGRSCGRCLRQTRLLLRNPSIRPEEAAPAAATADPAPEPVAEAAPQPDLHAPRPRPRPIARRRRRRRDAARCSGRCRGAAAARCAGKPGGPGRRRRSGHHGNSGRRAGSLPLQPRPKRRRNQPRPQKRSKHLWPGWPHRPAPPPPTSPACCRPRSAPAPADLPDLPPLTPEEEALLREIAEDGPGTALPSGLVPEAAPEAPSEPPVAGEAPPEDQILQPGGHSVDPAHGPRPVRRCRGRHRPTVCRASAMRPSNPAAAATGRGRRPPAGRLCPALRQSRSQARLRHRPDRRWQRGHRPRRTGRASLPGQLRAGSDASEGGRPCRDLPRGRAGGGDAGLGPAQGRVGRRCRSDAGGDGRGVARRRWP